MTPLSQVRADETAARAPADRASATIVFRAFAVESPGGQPLADVRVCVDRHSELACARSSRTGAFELRVPGRSETAITLTLAGREPVLVPFVTTNDDESGFQIGMHSAAEVGAVARDMNVRFPPSPGMGALMTGAPPSRDAQAGVAGITVAISESGKGPLYLASDSDPDSDTRATSARGVAYFAELAPGALTVTFSSLTGAKLECSHGFGGWPSPLPNSVRVPIAAGFYTHVAMACQPVP